MRLRVAWYWYYTALRVAKFTESYAEYDGLASPAADFSARGPTVVS